MNKLHVEAYLSKIGFTCTAPTDCGRLTLYVQTRLQPRRRDHIIIYEYFPRPTL